MNRIILMILIFLVILMSGCETKDRHQDYNKCAQVCASVLEEDFVELSMCREECKRQFLDSG